MYKRKAACPSFFLAKEQYTIIEDRVSARIKQAA